MRKITSKHLKMLRSLQFHARVNRMLTLKEICQKRKAQIENRNGRAALHERIEQMTQLRDPLRFIAALKLKGYIEALCDQKLMTLTDANDWLQIVDTKYRGVN